MLKKKKKERDFKVLLRVQSQIDGLSKEDALNACLWVQW